MTITDIKQLELIIKLCRKTGVESIKIDNVELHLGAEPRKETKAPKANKKVMYAPGGITEETQIETDALTEDELLFYSASNQEQQ